MVMTQKLRGVNVGGWLVLEKWLAPRLFAGMTAEDEYSLCEQLGRQKRHTLEAYRTSFITEQDIQLLARSGINALRIPVSYGIFGNEAPLVGGLSHLDRAVVTAARYSIQVLIDLHAAPGSQNGWDHSGSIGEVCWTDPGNITKTLAVLERLAKRYGNAPNLWGIEVLNEPKWDIPKEVLADFYERAYGCIRKYAPESVAVVLHDSFRPTIWADILNDKPNVVIDTHLYQCFSEEDRRLSFDEHLQKAAGWAEMIAAMQQTHQVIVGEWSMALHGSFSAAQKQAYAKAQLAAFAQAAGQFYWTYKKENPDDWSWLTNRSLLI
ncbi:MAG TPA: cellulase family glycosylhydrolase [Candidatus Saccharimonadales bacterium]|nr:cellulase family glycosylhydrolase [Candidatus Saccharimonadales bacterium]